MKPPRLLSANGLKSAIFATSSSSQLKFAFNQVSSAFLLILFKQYTTCFKRGNDDIKQKAVYTGNHVKSMLLSVEASLKKLRTHYIDILYVHWWDFETSVEEVMNGLHVLINQGKVLYLVCPPSSSV